MSDYEYWKKQSLKPLFAEIDTERPEQKRFAGKLLIIGGNKNVFFAVANAMNEAKKMNIGEVRVLMPSSLRNKIPATPEVYFAEAENSGVFGKNALNEMLIQAEWADAVVLIGDTGKNAETTVVFADFIKRCEKPIFATRDAIDVVTPDAMNWGVSREAETVLLLTVPQLQKMLRTMYYPKVITLSMPTNQLIEILHKFSISYSSLCIATYHNGQLIVAQNGEVVTEELGDTNWTQISLWSGSLAIYMVGLRLWNLNQSAIKVATTALIYE